MLLPPCPPPSASPQTDQSSQERARVVSGGSEPLRDLLLFFRPSEGRPSPLLQPQIALFAKRRGGGDLLDRNFRAVIFALGAVANSRQSPTVLSLKSAGRVVGRRRQANNETRAPLKTVKLHLSRTLAHSGPFPLALHSFAP